MGRCIEKVASVITGTLCFKFRSVEIKVLNGEPRGAVKIFLIEIKKPLSCSPYPSRQIRWRTSSRPGNELEIGNSRGQPPEGEISASSP